MPDKLEPHQDKDPGTSSVDYGNLFDQAQIDPEVEPASPERQHPNRESLTVTYLNTSFSGVFNHPKGLDGLLLRDQRPRENSVYGFSEVTHAQRPIARTALEARGYQVVEPPEDSRLDLIWAVGPGLEIELTDAHHFSRTGLRRVASRTSSEAYRHVGIQDLTIATPEGNKVRLGHERLSPWLVEPVRRMQLKDMNQVLREQFPPDDDVVLTVNGGDMNHIGPFRKPDDRLWGKMKDEGWEPVIEPGTPTHSSADKYNVPGRVFRALGRKSDETQLDAVYARPRSGTNLIDAEATTVSKLEPNQIGYSTQTMKIEGTDHYAVETTFSLPVQ